MQTAQEATFSECRRTFFNRIAFLAPSDRFFIRKAYDIAKATHSKQWRKQVVDGMPVRYFEHPRDVAIILIDELHIVEREPLALALVHDVLEDAESNADMSPEYLEFCFPHSPLVMRAQLLTIEKGKPGETPEETASRKARYVRRLAMYADLETLIVKAADRLHNLRCMRCEGVPRDFIVRKTDETRSYYLDLFETMRQRAAPTRYASAANVLCGTIREEVARNDEYVKTLTM